MNAAQDIKPQPRVMWILRVVTDPLLIFAALVVLVMANRPEPVEAIDLSIPPIDEVRAAGQGAPVAFTTKGQVIRDCLVPLAMYDAAEGQAADAIFGSHDFRVAGSVAMGPGGQARFFPSRIISGSEGPVRMMRLGYPAVVRDGGYRVQPTQVCARPVN